MKVKTGVMVHKDINPVCNQCNAIWPLGFLGGSFLSTGIKTYIAITKLFGWPEPSASVLKM